MVIGRLEEVRSQLLEIRVKILEVRAQLGRFDIS